MKKHKLRRYLLRLIFPPLFIYDKTLFILEKRRKKLAADKHFIDLNKACINTENNLFEKSLISFLIPCRIKDNNNSNLSRCIRSIIDNAHKPHLIEILLKFDEDDNYQKVLEHVVDLIANRCRLKYIVTPKGRGYLDLHKFYNDLFMISDVNSVYILGATDDIEMIHKGYDTVLFDIYKNKIGSRDVARMIRCEYRTKHAEFSFYTRKWYEIQRGFGFFQGIDIWNYEVKLKIEQLFGLNVEIAALEDNQSIIRRNVSEVCDTFQGRNWTGIQFIMNNINSPFFQKMLTQIAVDIVNYEKHSEHKILEIEEFK